MRTYLPKNKGVWSETTGVLEKRVGPAKLLRKAKLAGVGGAGRSAASAIIQNLTEKKRK